MLFNPDITKPAEEVLFTNRSTSTYCPIAFDGIAIEPVSDHKHLGLILDSKLTFNKHIDEKISIANRGVGVIRRLYHYSPRKSMIQIYKSFIRPHLDYCDIIYHKPLHDIFSSEYYSERVSSDPLHNNEQFTNKIEAVQYNSALAITGCIRGTSREKLYSELQGGGKRPPNYLLVGKFSRLVGMNCSYIPNLVGMYLFKLFKYDMYKSCINYARKQISRVKCFRLFPIYIIPVCTSLHDYSFSLLRKVAKCCYCFECFV